MKKLLTLVVAVTMLFASCSKERKLNKKLDGVWNGVSMTDHGVSQTITAPASIVLTFGKDKKDNGTYSFVYGDGTFSVTDAGTYTLTDDKTITLTSPGSAPDVWTVTKYSKTDLTITDSDGDVYVFKKK